MSAKSDATRKPVSFDFDGETYTIPPAAEWDLDVLEAAEDGRNIAMIRALLGEEGWTTFRSKPRTVADLTEMTQAIEKAVGSGN